MNAILKYNEVAKEVSYKCHSIKMVIDGFGQEFFLVDDSAKLYFSMADAKKVIRGEQPKYEEFHRA
jgi:hypothetical protein